MKGVIFFILVLSVLILASVSVNDVYAIGIEVRDEKGQLVSSIGSTSGNPFEFGIWAFPVITVNLILLGIGIMYYKRKLPNQIEKSIKFVYNFEVSARISYAIIIGLLAIYIGFSLNEIEHSEEISWGDYASVKKYVSEYTTIDNVLNEGLPVRYTLLSISLNIFGNIRIIPFVASIALLVLTYFFTVKITQKRFSGILAMVILLQSPLFLRYDITATYENLWTLFYLFSLYLVHKKWYVSPISFILSMLSKALSILLLPMTFMFIYDSELSQKKKIQITITYLTVIALIVAIVLFRSSGWLEFPPFDYDVFVTGFKALLLFLRFDSVVITLLLPLIVGLFVLTRKGVLHANSFMFLIFGMLISAPILAGLTSYTNQPYRFVPLVVFFAIGVGLLFSKRVQILPQEQNRKRILHSTIFLMTLVTVSLNLAFVIFPNLIVTSQRLILTG